MSEAPIDFDSPWFAAPAETRDVKGSGGESGVNCVHCGRSLSSRFGMRAGAARRGPPQVVPSAWGDHGSDFA
ncbi:MAG: hypothetical protein AMXMBFR47_16020 [Planctomycetota bacterium]